jgi:hypothetical protein
VERDVHGHFQCSYMKGIGCMSQSVALVAVVRISD